MYERVVKRLFDIVLSGLGMILLSWLFLILALVISVSDPGAIIFTQRRIGKGKTYFQLHKFRTMKTSAPHDVPTHIFEDPEKYITKVGAFLRKSSMDELPQLWDIFIGNMSIVGPRPALWNQEDLIEERDKFGANDVKPGLTGWAQINGRDELPLAVKAKLDGEYVIELKKGGWHAFYFDCKCILRTVSSVAKGEGVVEGLVEEARGYDEASESSDEETQEKT